MSKADPRAILAELQRLLPNAHAPYSGVHVSAAVETADGRVCYGVNVENAAYPQGVCAEASAISMAVTQGPTRIERVYVASSLPEQVWPCGGCRQKIFELAQAGCEVVAVSPGGETDSRTIEQLLPLGFRLEPGRPLRV
jgi:cytidine deaminase